MTDTAVADTAVADRVTDTAVADRLTDTLVTDAADTLATDTAVADRLTDIAVADTRPPGFPNGNVAGVAINETLKLQRH